MNNVQRYSPLLFLLMWSSGALFVKSGLEDASVSVFLAIRSIGAAFLLLAICAFILRGGIERLALPCPQVYKACGIGLVLQVGYQSCFFLALDDQLTPGVLAIILGLQPVLTPLIARERVGPWGMLCLLLGLCGLSVAVLGARELGVVTPMGVLFGGLAVLSISVGSVMQKRAAIDPIASAFYQSLAASVIFLAVMPFTQVHLQLTPRFVLAAGWMIVVVSTLAVILLFHLLSTQSASQVGVLFYLVPVVTLALDYLVFGHRVGGMTAAGAALVIIAIRGFGVAQSRRPSALGNR